MRPEPYTNKAHSIYTCTYINDAKTILDRGIKYRSNKVVGWEDTAFSVECNRAGLSTLQLYGICYSSDPTTITPGGCNTEITAEECMRKTAERSALFMKNVANGDPTFRVKVLPKIHHTVIDVDLSKVKREV